MLDHITLPVSNYEAAKAFYQRALAPLGYSLLMEVQGYAGFGMQGEHGPLATFWIHAGEKPISATHVAFTAKDRKTVDTFYNTAIEAGGKDNGKPGIREIYHPSYYGAFVFDLDGYNIEAVCHQPE